MERNPRTGSGVWWSTPVEINDADKALLTKIVSDHVLAQFSKRCGSQCAKEWNATIGEIAGAKAPE